MSNSCAIVPKVINKLGKKVDSKLFKDLLSLTQNNREKTKLLYYITKNQEFINEVVPRLDLDNNNEPTLYSLIRESSFSLEILEELILKKLNRDIGYYKKGEERPALWVNNNENYRKLKEKAIDFNTKSGLRNIYIASVVKIWDKESKRIYIGVKVEKRNSLNSINSEKMEYNESLDKKLREILKRFGVSIGALTELEKLLGINGVTDFDTAKRSALGLIELIRLADGIRGKKALPEEFAHFAIEAMGDNPLINRLINLISSLGLVREIIEEDFDTYNILYKGDEAKLAKEAAGKLLAKHLLNAELIPLKPYKNLLLRVIEAIKNFFKTIKISSIEKAMLEANKGFNQLAYLLLGGNIDNIIDINNIKSNDLYYNTTQRVNRDKKLFLDIIKNEIKRFEIYKRRNPNSNFNVNLELFINKLKTLLQENNEIEGIYSFLSHALDLLGLVNNRLINMQSSLATNINERAKTLIDVRDYIYSYKHIIKDIRDILLDEEASPDNRYGERIRTAVNDTHTLIEDLEKRFDKVAFSLFTDAVKTFLGKDSLTFPIGKWKGVTITVEDMIRGVKYDEDGKILWYQKDISFFDRWLDSMADSSDFMLKIIGRMVVETKETARLDTIDLIKEIQKAAIQLELAGVKDTSWMFERDSKGNLTGNYIREINYGLYNERKREFLKSLEEKYGKNPIGDDAIKYSRERTAWFDSNLEIVNNKRVPKKSIYSNKEYEQLSSAKRAYYDKIMEIKELLDSYLPKGITELTNTIKIRKDLLERIKSSDIKGGKNQILEAFKDLFIRRSDDIDFGEAKTLKDFEGNEVMSLPIYYIQMRKGESANDLSTDVTSTLAAYASMAINYREMNKVVDTLEVGRILLRERETILTRGDKPLVEKLFSLGENIETALTKSGDKSRYILRLNDFFEMQVYERYIADEGTFGNTNIDKAKVADFVNMVTALNMLGFNVLSGISNVATGTVMMRIESIAKLHFSESDTLKADNIYKKALLEYLGEIGSRVKVSKLALWDELFNVLLEYELDVRELNFDRKNLFSRKFETDSVFFLNNAGEHWMQNRTSLALALNYMKAPDGSIVSLWDAMEVVFIDPNNKSLGATLQVKKGYTKKDGTEFTKKDIINFSRKTAAINFGMHGIYNKLDRSAFLRIAVGRMASIFRKWIRPAFNKRFKSVTYNLDLQEWTEGYYISTKNFLLLLAKGLKEGLFALGANWEQLDNIEKANIRRAATEVTHLVVLALILGLIDWPDDKDRPWAIKMAEYLARRLFTELGAMTPGPLMILEGLRIIKSPAAGINTLEGALDLVGLINPYNYETFGGEDAVILSGRYKGHNKAYRLFFESPAIPMNKTIYKGIHPEEGIPFFKL